MKIAASKLQTGMTVKYGNVWIAINRIALTNQKNGSPTISIFGTSLAGTIRRGNGLKQRIESQPYDCIFKSTTIVNVK